MSNSSVMGEGEGGGSRGEELGRREEGARWRGNGKGDGRIE